MPDGHLAHGGTPQEGQGPGSDGSDIPEHRRWTLLLPPPHSLHRHGYGNFYCLPYQVTQQGRGHDKHITVTRPLSLHRVRVHTTNKEVGHDPGGGDWIPSQIPVCWWGDRTLPPFPAGTKQLTSFNPGQYYVWCSLEMRRSTRQRLRCSGWLRIRQVSARACMLSRTSCWT